VYDLQSQQANNRVTPHACINLDEPTGSMRDSEATYLWWWT